MGYLEVVLVLQESTENSNHHAKLSSGGAPRLDIPTKRKTLQIAAPSYLFLDDVAFNISLLLYMLAFNL